MAKSRPSASVPKCRRSGRLLKMPSRSVRPEVERSEPSPVLHCPPPVTVRGKLLEFFHSFDADYLNRLQQGDSATQEHFVAYFSTLLRIKLAYRMKPEQVDDTRQETFERFFRALQEGKIREPERLGAYVLSICKYVIKEDFRKKTRECLSIDSDDDICLPTFSVDMVGLISAKEKEQEVRHILDELSEHDRKLLRAIFLEERDKDEVCAEFGVSREYLRVLVHRAKQEFKKWYDKSGGGPSSSASG